MKFHILDVFAENKYQGNQLAVFRNAGHLSSDEMLQIAREINFQESTFILSESPKNGAYDVRIFTPEYEVPFAGHPTLGTTYIIKKYLQNTDNEQVILNLKIGQVPVIEINDTYWLTISNPIFKNQFKPDEVGFLIDLAPDMISDDLPIEIVTTGLPYLIVPLKSIEAVQSVNFEVNELKGWLIENHFYKDNSEDNLTLSFFIFTTETVNAENDFHARMFCFENGKIVEDAATGSANSCLLAYLLKNSEFHKNKAKSGLKVEQGYEMNRPSLIQIKGDIDEIGNYSLEVGGKVKEVGVGDWII